MSAVVRSIEDAARWREAKAEEYPDDVRNLNSAAALQDLAAYVETIPSDPRVLWLDAQGQHPYDSILVGTNAPELLNRYGFDMPANHDTFLGELCVMVAEDVLELVADGAITPWEAVAHYRIHPRDAHQVLIEPMSADDLADYADPESLVQLLPELHRGIGGLAAV